MWSMNTDLCCPALRGALEYILRLVRKLMSTGDVEATHAHVIEKVLLAIAPLLLLLQLLRHIQMPAVAWLLEGVTAQP